MFSYFFNSKEYFLKNCIYSNNFVEFYSTNAREFIPNIIIWMAQRNVNEKHVNDLYNMLKTHKHFIGTFKLVKDENNNLRLIDGQHRYFAIKKYLEDNGDFDMTIILEVYKVDKIDSEYTIELFKKSNNVLNMNGVVSVDCHNIILKLNCIFPGVFKDIPLNKICHRPRVNKRKLYLLLKDMISQYDKEELLSLIISKNKNCNKLPRKSFKKVSETMYNKAKSLKFCLGLIELDKWL